MSTGDDGLGGGSAGREVASCTIDLCPKRGQDCLAAKTSGEAERERTMKKIVLMLVLGLSLILGSTVAFAGGDQNQGQTGIGSTILGGSAQGAAEQPRAGR